MPSGQINPSFRAAARSLKNILEGNSFLYYYEDSPKASKIKDVLSRSDMSWLVGRLVPIKKEGGSLVSQLTEHIQKTLPGRPITFLLNGKELRLADIESGTGNKFVVLPTLDNKEFVIGPVQMLALSIIAGTKHEILIAVGDAGMYKNTELQAMLANRNLTYFITLPIRIFEEIQKAINSLRQTAVAA